MAASTAVTDPPSRRISHYFARLMLACCGAFATCWLLGFAWFLFLASREPAPAGPVDAIVVLTGGPDRVEVALRLLAGGTAGRLLVTGAGERTDVAALAHLAGLDPVPLEPHITIGRAARTTRGNALETASWAREQHIGSVLVVTAWFHMPRALVELRRAMPKVTSEPFPVGRLTAEEMVHGGAARRVIGEYHKYLAALAGLTDTSTAIAGRATEPVG
jgi:uncharacterized SAM-binding protein YcdF (DUF218 family)